MRGFDGLIGAVDSVTRLSLYSASMGSPRVPGHCHLLASPIIKGAVRLFA
jgi:hypothetical protein